MFGADNKLWHHKFGSSFKNLLKKEIHWLKLLLEQFKDTLSSCEPLSIANLFFPTLVQIPGLPFLFCCKFNPDLCSGDAATESEGPASLSSLQVEPTILLKEIFC